MKCLNDLFVFVHTYDIEKNMVNVLTKFLLEVLWAIASTFISYLQRCECGAIHSNPKGVWAKTKKDIHKDFKCLLS